jgi:hypothetical protein
MWRKSIVNFVFDTLGSISLTKMTGIEFRWQIIFLISSSVHFQFARAITWGILMVDFFTFRFYGLLHLKSSYHTMYVEGGCVEKYHCCRNWRSTYSYSRPTVDSIVDHVHSYSYGWPCCKYSMVDWSIAIAIP